VTSASKTQRPLTGTLPPEWAAMTSLTTLTVDYNAITGALPVEWASYNRSNTSQLTVSVVGCPVSSNVPASYSTANIKVVGLAFPPPPQPPSPPAPPSPPPKVAGRPCHAWPTAVLVAAILVCNLLGWLLSSP
jgi:hypothetical protein